MAEDFQAMLNDPDYQGLPPERQTEIRRGFYRKVASDPDFQSLPGDRRQTIGRGILFPNEARDDKPVVTPQPSRGFMGSAQDEAAKGEEAMRSGWEQLKQGQTFSGPLNMAAGAAQRIGAPVIGPWNEYVSRPLGNLTRQLPVPDPETLGQQVEMATDIAGPTAASKALGALKAPLARALPTVKEKLTDLGATRNAANAANATARDQRIADVYKGADKQTVDLLKDESAKLGAMPGKRAAAEARGTADIATERANLVQQQEAVGQKAAEAGAPIPPKSKNFNARYTRLKELAKDVPTQPVNLNAASRKITQERGIQTMPTNQAERTAGATHQLLTDSQAPMVEEEIGNTVRRMIDQGTDAKSVDYPAITRKVLGQMTEDSSLEALYGARQRIRAAQTASYKAGHRNLGRQFGDMEDAITQDILETSKANPKANRINKVWDKVDADYRKQKASEWYAEGIDTSFDPKTGNWDRSKFTKWWEKHADGTNNDRDLRRMLGSQYDSTKGLVEDMQKANDLNIEKVSREAAGNIRRRTLGEVAGVNQAEADLKAFSAERAKNLQKSNANEVKQAGKDFDLRADAIEKEINDKAKEISGKPWNMGGKFFGSIGVVHGIATMNPVMVATGVATLMTHGMLNRLINSTRGLSVVRRLVRATPGTGEAISAGIAATNLAKEFKDIPDEPTPEQAQATEKATSSAAAKKNLFDKYKIQ